MIDLKINLSFSKKKTIAYEDIQLSLFDEHREALEDETIKFIGLYGGRGGIKTFSVNQFLTKESFNPEYKNKNFILGREIADAIDSNLKASFESVINLVDELNDGKIKHHFTIKRGEIINNVTNVKVLFKGFRVTEGKTKASQIDKVKGMADIAFLYIDEAATISEEMLNALFPTANRQFTINGVEAKNSTRMIFTWNRYFSIDPILKKLLTYKTKSKIIFKNIFDLPEEFQDIELIEQAKAERNEWYYDHVWLGEPFAGLSGLPFINIPIEELDDKSVMNGGTAFFDLSFKGGDYSSLACVKKLPNGKVIAFVFVWKRAWIACVSDVVRIVKEYDLNLYYEENGQGIVPRDEFYKYGVSAQGRETSINKEDKIYGVGYLVRDDLILISNHGSKEGLEMVCNYSSTAEYDDGPDALVMALMELGYKHEKLKLNS